ncbi:DNA circularization protein [Erwinia rhapontici]|uniref:DNA circularization protein n=1 Tax=Erwinia rhapontici TaxID=55212 RepID=UPI001438357D|nr:DNA circularization N-terminal domain-containing protein [Erwinia rhapontici]NKG32124.1 DNA circularization protein [Erwinia rhapontici]
MAAKWKDYLQDASLRDVPFKVSEDEATFGRRVQVHEYPQRDKPFAEDMGRATRKFSVQAYVIGDDFFIQRNKLIEAIEKPGACTLVHPYYGEMEVILDETVRVSHSVDEGRMCRITFSFVEAGELSFPTSGIATGSKLNWAVAALDDCISSAFESFGLDGMSDFMQSDVIKEATDMVDTITAVYQYVDSGITAASRLLQGDLSVLLSPPSSGMTFVNKLQTMMRAGLKLNGDASDLMSAAKSFSAVALLQGLSPRYAWKTDSKTTQATTVQRNHIAQAIRTVALSEAAYTVINLPQPPAVTVTEQNSTQPVKVPHPAVNDIIEDSAGGSPGVTTSTNTANVPSWDELADVRESFNAAIDQEMVRVTDDALFLALRQVRTDLNNDISTRLEQVSRVTVRTPLEVVPALVLAADWYDSAARESDITARNGIRHPGFVPVQPLRVPVR